MTLSHSPRVERVRGLADVDAGVVDEDVDAGRAHADAFDHGGDRGLVGDIGGDAISPWCRPV